MTLPKPKKVEKNQSNAVLVQVNLQLEPDHESSIVTEQWYVRQQLCLAISLAFSHIRRDTTLKAKWDDSDYGKTSLRAMEQFTAGCSLKTATIASIVKSCEIFCEENRSTGRRTAQVMMQAIIQSCREAYSKWLSYEAYEGRVKNAIDINNANDY